ncbi:unnamed protein product [Cochlearia groenlandica]
MSTEQPNQVAISSDEERVPLLRSEVVKSSAGKMEKKRTKRKNESAKDTPVKKKKELSSPEDVAKAIGKMMKFTGKGVKKKCHYKKFEFHGQQYALEDSVLLVPEDAKREPYAAIIKDIYAQGKEGYVKIDVQWFYRLEDVDKKHLRNFDNKDSRNIFYSFHHDKEVFAESVVDACVVHFVPENKQVPNREDHDGFIVQRVYNFAIKKLCKFTSNSFNKQQKHDIDLLVAKTVSRIGELPDIVKKEEKPKPKESVRKCNGLELKKIMKKFDMFTGDSDRDKCLQKILGAVKGECPNNEVVPVVLALEEALYESFGEDSSKYNDKVEVVATKLMGSPKLAYRILIGDLKPEQIVTMTPYELTRGYTFDEMVAVIE